MSTDPMIYTAPPVPSARPTVITVLGILGIVFSSIGLLCGGAGLLSSIFLIAVKQTNVGRVPVPPLQIALGITGFLLAGMLLLASIGSLQLKPQARKLMIAWALADIVFDTAKAALTMIFILPITTQQAAAANPNAAAFARGGLIVGSIIGWLFAVSFAVVIWIFFHKKSVISAFERGAAGYDPIMQPMPTAWSPPPPPGAV